MLKKILILLGIVTLFSASAVFAKCNKECRKMEHQKNILMVVTSADKYGNGIQTGVWFEEYAIPYKHFETAGYKITVASPKGGNAPIVNASIPKTIPSDWNDAMSALKATVKLDKVEYKHFDAIVLPGGHGPLVDLANDKTLANILTYFDSKNLIIASVCHGPAGLVSAKNKDGKSILAGRKVTGFSNKEEEIAGHTKDVPFALETRLKELGANYSAKEPWSSYVVVDKNLITGQNPQSSEELAETIVNSLK